MDAYIFQATYPYSMYEESLLWKNLVIAIVAVCISFE